MNEELDKIIKASTFSIENGIYLYAKVKKVPQGKHFLITQDNDEVTVVTTLDKLSNLDLIERNKDDYALIALHVLVPFYSVGFLATISTAIAKRGLNILIVSTYSKDYIMVKSLASEIAKQALLDLGFSKK